MEPTKALTARTYSAPGEIAIAVTDDSVRGPMASTC